MFEIELKAKFAKKINKEIEAGVKKIIDGLKVKLSKFSPKFIYKTKITEQELILSIESDMLTATDFLVQFDKQVRETIGREFKTGIKEIIIEKYVISTELEEAPKKELKLPLVKKVQAKNKTLTLEYDNISLDWVKDHYIEKTIKLAKDKIRMANYEGKDEFRETVWEGKKRNIKYNLDPAVELEKINWIRRTPAKGQYVYGREYTALMNVMKELMIENIYAKLGFFEMTFPKFEPWAIPIKSGHAKNIYPNAYFVSVPKNSSPEYWEEVMDLFAITGEVKTELVKEKSDCVGIMSYAQCPPFWPYLENKVIDEQTLPLKVYDWSGPTYRNESGGTHGLDRVEEFNRVETLFVGTKEQVIKVWQDLKKVFIEFYDGVLDLELKAARVTPWWMAHAGAKTEKGNEEMGTFDFDAYLPYRGNRDKEWLEIQNDSSNGDKYPNAFNVKGKSGQLLWSGCAGTSFQRIIVAFLAQKGLDPKNWPKDVRDRFEKRMKGLKELKFY